MRDNSPHANSLASIVILGIGGEALGSGLDPIDLGLEL